MYKNNLHKSKFIFNYVKYEKIGIKKGVVKRDTLFTENFYSTTNYKSLQKALKAYPGPRHGHFSRLRET